MRKAQYLLVLLSFLGLTSMTSCGPPAEQKVQLIEMQDQVITFDRLESLLSKHDVITTWKPRQEGASIHAVVLSFDLLALRPSDVTYDEVIITARILDDSGAAAYEGTDDVSVLATIPEKVEQLGTITVSSKFAASIEAVASELTGKKSIKVGGDADQTTTETRSKVYRVVTGNTRHGPLISWTFASDKGISILPGTYLGIAVIEVRDPTHAYHIHAYADCQYGKSILFGLLPRATNNCIPDQKEIVLEQASPPASSQPPGGESAPPVPPISSQKMVLVFAGQATIREAVLNAVDWSSLMRDQNVILVFKGMEGETVELAARRQDLARCKQLLAQAGYPNGYPGFRVIISPASESLMQVGEGIAANLSQCGLGKGPETINSYADAYSILRQISMGGEAGLLLSGQ